MQAEAVVTAIWRRWEQEEITLVQLLEQLQACGWERRAIFERLEREAEAHAGRQALANHPKLGPAPARRLQAGDGKPHNCGHLRNY